LSRVLAASMVVLGVVGAHHMIALMRGAPVSLPLISAWLLVTPLALGIQIRAGSAWLQRSLERARDQLEGRVRERTEALARSNASLMLENAERRAAEAALRASEERWRTVSELSSDLSFSFRVDASGAIVDSWMTDAVERLTGYRFDELEGNGSRQIVHPDAPDGSGPR